MGAATVNASLISGLNEPIGIAVSGSDLFVANYYGGGTVDEYTTAGATVNAALLSGLSSPSGIAVSGSDLFVANAGNDTIGEYTTSWALVNAALISEVGRACWHRNSHQPVRNPRTPVPLVVARINGGKDGYR
jgi:hypothetical protein